MGIIEPLVRGKGQDFSTQVAKKRKVFQGKESFFYKKEIWNLLSLGSYVALGIDCFFKVPSWIRYSSLTVLAFRALSYLGVVLSEDLSNEDIEKARIRHRQLIGGLTSVSKNEQDILDQIEHFLVSSSTFNLDAKQKPLAFNRFIQGQLSIDLFKEEEEIGFTEGAYGLQFSLHSQSLSEAFINKLLEVVFKNFSSIAFLDLSKTKNLYGSVLISLLKERSLKGMNLSFCSNFNLSFIPVLVKECKTLGLLDLKGLNLSSLDLEDLKGSTFVLKDGVDLVALSEEVKKKIEVLLEGLRVESDSKERKELIHLFFTDLNFNLRGVLSLISSFAIKNKAFITSQDLNSILKNLNFYTQNLKKFSIEEAPLVDKEFFENLSLSPLGLEELTLKTCPLFKAGSLKSILSLKSLRRLYLDSCGVSWQKVRELALSSRANDVINNDLEIFVDGQKIEVTSVDS
ncbi:hypothetical protein AB751O23_AD_00050 [Chlamydiales bacterium SCGC AB-751-O23]|nr:hypothetical protein AB751O23_AD_00050 [Chlamydiales bacterium SCGC AB-751-O23]